MAEPRYANPIYKWILNEVDIFCRNFERYCNSQLKNYELDKNAKIAHERLRAALKFWNRVNSAYGAEFVSLSEIKNKIKWPENKKGKKFDKDEFSDEKSNVIKSVFETLDNYQKELQKSKKTYEQIENQGKKQINFINDEKFGLRTVYKQLSKFMNLISVMKAENKNTTASFNAIITTVSQAIERLTKEIESAKAKAAKASIAPDSAKKEENTASGFAPLTTMETKPPASDEVIKTAEAKKAAVTSEVPKKDPPIEKPVVDELAEAKAKRIEELKNIYVVPSEISTKDVNREGKYIGPKDLPKNLYFSLQFLNEGKNKIEQKFPDAYTVATTKGYKVGGFSILLGVVNRQRMKLLQAEKDITESKTGKDSMAFDFNNESILGYIENYLETGEWKPLPKKRPVSSLRKKSERTQKKQKI
jgi:hypothetical protein